MFIKIGNENILNLEQHIILGVHLFEPLSDGEWRVAVDYRSREKQVDLFGRTSIRTSQMSGKYPSEELARAAFEALWESIGGVEMGQLGK